MVVDILRCHYLGRVRGLVVGDQVYEVRWYPTAPGAKALPLYTAFGSAVWEPDVFDHFDGPGELHGRNEWRPKKYAKPPGDHYHGLPEWFLDGLPQSVYDGPVVARDCGREIGVLRVRYEDGSVDVDDVALIEVGTQHGTYLLGAPGSGKVVLDNYDASPTQAGVVTTGPQTIGGVKSFADGIELLTSYVTFVGPNGDGRLLLAGAESDFLPSFVVSHRYQGVESAYFRLSLDSFTGYICSIGASGSGTTQLKVGVPGGMSVIQVDGIAGSGYAVGNERGVDSDPPSYDPIPGVRIRGGIIVSGSSTALPYSDEQAQDAVGAILVSGVPSGDGSQIDLEYDDDAPALRAALVVVDGGTW
jgi:hypothetical protein